MTGQAPVLPQRAARGDGQQEGGGPPQEHSQAGPQQTLSLLVHAFQPDAGFPTTWAFL